MKAKYKIISVDTMTQLGTLTLQYFSGLQLHHANFEASDSSQSKIKEFVFLHKATGFSFTYSLEHKDVENEFNDKLFHFFGEKMNLKYIYS